MQDQADLRTAVADYLRRARQHARLSQEAFAAELRSILGDAELSRVRVSYYETGKNRAPAEVLVAASWIAGLSLDEVFLGTKPLEQVAEIRDEVGRQGETIAELRGTISELRELIDQLRSQGGPR